VTDDDERVRSLVRQEMEIFIKAHGWPDDVVHQALLDVARNHIWQQGLWARLKFVVNIIGFVGVIGGAVLLIVSVFGYDVVRK
jgi:hypothetical protein